MRFTNLTKKTPLALGLIASIAALPVVADIADEISELALPHIFQAGTPARADEVNQNFDAIKNAVNQNFNAVVTSLERIEDADTRLDEVETRVDEVESALDESGAPANVLEVALEGAEFDSVKEALDAAAAEATADNPIVVLVQPGVYDAEDSLLTVAPNVHLKGASRTATVIRSNRSSPAPTNAAAGIEVLSGGRVSDLTLEKQTAGNNQSIGIFASQADDSTLIENVDVDVQLTQNGVGASAALFRNSDVTVRNSKLSASGGRILNAALASLSDTNLGSKVVVENCELNATGNGANGMQVNRSEVELRDSEINSSEFGIVALIGAKVDVTNSKIDGTNARALLRTTGESKVNVASSELNGGQPSGLASSFRYVHCFRGDFTPIANGPGSSIQ
ncbi:MAG: hypothetical protein AAF517_07425 [Planctomycetota bacterium]